VWRGEPYPSTEPVIGDLAVAYPAEKAGLREGDRILALDGSAVETWSQLAEVIHKKPGLPVRVEYRRSEEKREVHVTPIREPNGTRGLIGIAPQVLHRPVPFLKAAGDGLRQCWFWTQYTVTTLAAKIVRLEKPELAGPVGIMQMIGKAAHSGLEEFLGLVGLISVAVGFFNLLPIPLLDGGHAAMYLWEGLTRRRLTAQAMSNANTVGLAFLLGVLLFATYQDLSRIRRPPWKQEAPKEESAKPEPPGSAPPVERPAASK